MAEKPAVFNVKLFPGVEREEVFSKATGVLAVTPLFPDESDAELSTIYTVEIDPSKVESVVDVIRKDEHVEYIEKAPVRRLR